MTRSQLYRPSGPIQMTAVRFHPDGAVPFLKFHAAELTDSETDLSNMWHDASHVAAVVGEAEGAEGRLRHLQAALLSRLADVSHVDKRIQTAVCLFEEPSSSVASVAATLNTTRQHPGCLFGRHVGISPKAFARVVRMQSLRDRVGQTHTVNWSAAAVDSGYYDQAHMIAECRSLTGLTPCELLQS